jgi:hypothetical protein
MPDARERRPDFTRDRRTGTGRAAAGPVDADTDALGLASGRRAAVSRRADQAALAAAVRELRSRGRLDYVR